MSNIERTLKILRPPLRKVAPQTYWFSLGFGLFNIILGYALFNVQILTTLQVVSIFPLQAWAVLFFLHGVAMVWFLRSNSWNVVRYLNVAGVAIKSAWWLELVSITITGRSPFLLIIWSLLLFLQVINYVYFMPRIDKDEH